MVGEADSIPDGKTVVVRHGSRVVPEIQVRRLVELHNEDGVDFPVDGDEFN